MLGNGPFNNVCRVLLGLRERHDPARILDTQNPYYGPSHFSPKITGFPKSPTRLSCLGTHLAFIKSNQIKGVNMSSCLFMDYLKENVEILFRLHPKSNKIVLVKVNPTSSALCAISDCHLISVISWELCPGKNPETGLLIS